jgi:hypothetical protein
MYSSEYTSGFSGPAASHLAAPPSPRFEGNVGQAPCFGSTRLDPFKNAMLESVAPERSLTFNLCVLLPDPTEVAA